MQDRLRSLVGKVNIMKNDIAPKLIEGDGTPSVAASSQGLSSRISCVRSKPGDCFCDLGANSYYLHQQRQLDSP